MSERPRITVPDLCPTHLSLFVHGAGLSPTEPWRAFVVGAQIALFQAVTVDLRAHERMGGVITNLPQIGCLACYKPDRFGEIVEVARTKDLGAIKVLGESWISEAQRTEPASEEA